jgi:repressor LexA
MRRPSVANKTREKILTFIRDFIAEKGYGPSIRDIQKGCQLSSTAVVQHHLNVLEREGHIHRDPEVFRSIQLAGRKKTVPVPLLGTIAAGEPIPVPVTETWQNEALETIDVAEDFASRKGVYALRVKGLSLIDALIDDGDIVLIEPVSEVNDGDMVAVWLKDKQEVTLKRIFREKGRVCLQPANCQMGPLYTHPDNIEIQGKVVAVIRRL